MKLSMLLLKRIIYLTWDGDIGKVLYKKIIY
jgi:hypothetical protein